ncbi:hypothetical protein [Anaerocellum danielii]|uniref:Uncharacterized protein n=1 Tax=Anaerocellum danielii TaxID=1387557 RepID=A0ABZ0U1S2_9FIRM|nr:hypothetical protein [Caldicellulosiruptor danielii]WPX09672.1 hypothetical protein SOJ16_000907 [Caldicellulosiruptor danielii]
MKQREDVIKTISEETKNPLNDSNQFFTFRRGGRILSKVEKKY